MEVEKPDDGLGNPILHNQLHGGFIFSTLRMPELDTIKKDLHHGSFSKARHKKGSGSRKLDPLNLRRAYVFFVCSHTQSFLGSPDIGLLT